MKFLVIILLGIALYGNTSDTYATEKNGPSSLNMLDSNIFKCFPLSVGNKWTWNVYRNFNPGLGYESALITSSHVIRNHKYYKTRWDTYTIYTNQYSSGFSYLRIDSTTGNLYSLNISGNDTNECIIDSLNTPLNDSAYIYCESGNGQWIHHTRSTYNIFNQSFLSEDFGWTNYFEAWSIHRYAVNLGKVYSRGQGMMSYTEITLRGCFINNTLYGDTNFILGVKEVSSEIPENFSLSQNYPNPFNPTTKIKFDIGGTASTETILSVYDVLGHEVAVLVDQQLQPGTYEADWDASAYPSGVYYYKLESGSFTETKKMVLIK